MRYTDEEAEEKYPNVIFLGNYFFIRDGAYIGEDAVIREGADIGSGAVIGEGADIGSGAVIGEGADIREGAVITTVRTRYTGNIYSLNSKMIIRIGCEHHTIAEWDAHGAAYARKDGEAVWWEEIGKYQYEYLKGEALRYQEKYLK
jgi:carbonic anhydrase/acetyltransferase-like protein (isoleucine patch superfamily)